MVFSEIITFPGGLFHLTNLNSIKNVRPSNFFIYVWMKLIEFFQCFNIYICSLYSLQQASSTLPGVNNWSCYCWNSESTVCSFASEVNSSVLWSFCFLKPVFSYEFKQFGYQYWTDFSWTEHKFYLYFGNGINADLKLCYNLRYVLYDDFGFFVK